VQNQQKIEWPRTMVVAKAYVDQLERSQALSADRIASLRKAIQSADDSHASPKQLAQNKKKLKGMAPSLEKSAAAAKTPADQSRMRDLAQILRDPAV
jgi:hypothetical protein